MSGRAPRRIVATAVLFALLVNLGLLLLAHVPGQKTLEGDERYYFELGRARAAGQERPHDPFWPPLYATVLSGIFRITGPRVLPVQLLQVALWLAVCLIWYRLSMTITGDRVAALATVGILLFGADLAPFAHYLWPELLHCALLSGALALIVGSGQEAGAVRPSPFVHLLAGLFLGLALLAKLLLLPLLPVIVILAALKAGDGRRLRTAGALALGVALPLVPVVAANAQAGQPLLASSGVFNVWLGLNDPALEEERGEIASREARRYRASAPTVAERNAIYRGKIADKIAAEGLPAILAAQAGKQYVRLFDRDTFFVQQLPGGARSAYRFDSPRLSLALRVYAYATHALLLAAAAFGLAFLPRRPLGWPHLLAGFILYNLGVFLVAHANPRFIVQLVPFLAFFGGIGVAQAGKLVRQAGSREAGERKAGIRRGAEGEPEREVGVRPGAVGEPEREVGVRPGAVGEPEREVGVRPAVAKDLERPIETSAAPAGEPARLATGALLASLALYLAFRSALLG